MKPVKVILTISAVLYFFRAFGLIFAQKELFGMFGVVLDPSAVWSSQFLGGMLAGLGIINWLSRNSAALSDPLRGILIGNFTIEIISMIVSAKGSMDGLFNSIGWSTVLQHAVFATAFGYVLFLKKGTTPGH